MISNSFDLMTEINPQPIIRIGTDLFLCHGKRRVRVLTLPSLCSNWRLLRGWNAFLDDDADASIEWSPSTDDIHEQFSDD